MAAPSRAEATRARLRDAAVAAFAEKGFHATTTRDIAAAAGMSPAAMYVHHRSKQELLLVISREGHQAALDVVRSARAASADPRTQLTAVARAFALFHVDHHTVARILNYELAALSPEHRAEIDELRTGIDRELRALVSEGVAAGVFDVPDPALAATALASMGIDIARWYREDGEWTPEQIGDYYADLALRLAGAA
ncbi:TetR family transcriptional regulator [Nocardioides sp. LML1-1-1.1]|uniref:TetR family transcriptional regulator n=1 Tax=Nocardioides sp. LML1-1-1.1 TaxID=3135248 RepID=UPI00344A4565